jgi:hypothetical protein
MEVIRLPKGHAARIVGRLVLNRRGDWISAVISVTSPMHGTNEFGEFETVEKAETHALNFAGRHHADVLYIEDNT